MKQKVTLKIKDISLLLDALNNSIVALNDVKNSFYFYCSDSLSGQWQNFKKNHNDDYDECVDILNERLKILHNVYYQLSEIEKT